MPRAVLTWRVLDETLVGTHHEPVPTGDTAARPGVLLLNPGPAPRAGNSDLSAHVGDRLASRGWHVFRFDLPGLGDSTGPMPATIDEYWRQVLHGRNDEVTRALAAQLLKRYEFSTLVVGGLCAAIVPLLRLADHPASGVAGMILLEPNFRLTVDNAPPPDVAGATTRRRAGSVLGWTTAPRRWREYLTGENTVARAVLPLRKALRGVRRRYGAGTMPRDANLPLIARWRNTATSGIQTLAVVADGDASGSYVDRILSAAPFKGPGLVSVARVSKTNHILTGGAARDVVLAAIERWLSSTFASTTGPLPKRMGLGQRP